MDPGAESEHRITRRPTNRAYVGAAVLVVVLGAVVVLGGRGGEDAAPPSTTTPTSTTAPSGAVSSPLPTSIDGVPLPDPTGLELLVGGTLIDVDQDRRTWVGGLTDRPPGQAAGMSTFQVGGDTALVRYFSCEDCGPADVRVLVLPGGDTRSELVLADDRVLVAPAPDGLWVTHLGTDRCALRKIDLHGATVRAARTIDCGYSVAEETPLGLLAHSDVDDEGVPIPTDVLLDPDDLSVRVEARRILAVADDHVLVTDRTRGFEVRRTGGTTASMPPPRASGEPLRGPVSPDGRYAVIEFAGGITDLWVADLVELEWLHVPTFPTPVHPRRLGSDWADDGRLVVLGPLVESLGDREQVLATWTPGDEELAYRRVDYPLGELVVRSAA